MPNRYLRAVHGQNIERPPVWFMRQAGRYHQHYQRLKEKHSFIELCKVPALACETTMGPIDDFGFDAAILFSDLLFPLEVLGMGLDYVPGPKLNWHLKSTADLQRLRRGKTSDLVANLAFQGEALGLIRKKLPVEKGLLGFVGAPLTLFFYAAVGSHQNDLEDARRGMRDGRFMGFCELLVDLLAENMILQARSGADAVAVLDTCGGEIDQDLYAELAVPALKQVLTRFKRACPDTPVVYYSKNTDGSYWKSLVDLPIDCLGFDWNQPLDVVLTEWSSRFSIQGNVDPSWLFLEPSELEGRLREVFGRVAALSPSCKAAWICGLGHGVLPKTPEENVRLFLRLQREVFQ